MRAERRGSVQVAVDAVVQRGHVGRALDRGVAAQRHHAGARSSNVAEQELEQRAAADHLDAVGVLGPGDRVRERAGPVAAGILEQRLGDLDELLFRRAADLLHHFRRVAAEVPLQDLERAARVLEGRVALGGPRLERADQVVERRAGALGDQVFRGRTRSLRPALVRPAGVVVRAEVAVLGPEVGLLEPLEAREHSLEVFGILEVVVDDRRRVRVVDDELFEEGIRVPALRVDDVVDQPAEERDRKSTRLNSSHAKISYAVFCLKKNTPNRLARFGHYRISSCSSRRVRWSARIAFKSATPRSFPMSMRYFATTAITLPTFSYNPH